MVEVVPLPKPTPREEFALEQCAVLLRHARKQAGLTQARLAKKCDVSQARISQMETGEEKIGLTALVKIIDACGYHLQVNLVDARTDCVYGNVFLSPHRDTVL